VKDLSSCEPTLQLVYCTPEALQEVAQGEGNCPSLFQALRVAHEQQFLKLIAVDEAHVVSAWCGLSPLCRSVIVLNRALD
jgi:superfamily II DNA helicase RecQ